MAHVWCKWQKDDGDEADTSRPQWAIAPLADDAEAFVLTDDPQQPVRLRGKNRKDSVVAQILHIGDRRNEKWVLQSPERERIRVNGFPLVAGMRALRNQDEIRTDATGRMYFSTEREQRVEPFPGREEATRCPRCRGTIAKGEPAVQCPQCRTWQHETEELSCWTYSERCALCDQFTRLETGFRWTPEDL